jgi:twitching motility protein PilI
MANRQALRDLQSRLAERLQAARSEGTSVAWLAAESDGAQYLFPLSQAGEIFGWSALQVVPYTVGWFLGVANLRGGLYGVVDLAKLATAGANRSDLPAPVGRRAESVLAESSLLAFNPGLGVQSVLVIDKLSGLRGGDAFVDSRNATPESPAWFGQVYIDSAGTPWQEIDLQALSQDSSFLSISS